MPQFDHMPPKKATAQTGTVTVDGVAVPYSVDPKSKLVVVGTGVVSNNARDTFRQKELPALEQQIKQRPKFAAILAAALSTADGQSASAAASQSRELGALLTCMPPQPSQQSAPSSTISSSAASVDKHGNPLCSRCRGLVCAACELCSCLLWHDGGVAQCDGCSVAYCDVPCSRRGDCREEGNETHQKHYDYGAWPWVWAANAHAASVLARLSALTVLQRDLAIIAGNSGSTWKRMASVHAPLPSMVHGVSIGTPGVVKLAVSTWVPCLCSS